MCDGKLDLGQRRLPGLVPLGLVHGRQLYQVPWIISPMLWARLTYPQ
jgi:hypothetical protein